jgi:hypothetical protein
MSRALGYRWRYHTPRAPQSPCPPTLFAGLRALWKDCFRFGVTRPGFRNLVVILSGWILTQGPRAVTEALVVTDVSARRHWEAFHRFFSRGAWSPDVLGCNVFHRVERWFEHDVLRVRSHRLADHDRDALRSRHHRPLQDARSPVVSRDWNAPASRRHRRVHDGPSTLPRLLLVGPQPRRRDRARDLRRQVGHRDREAKQLLGFADSQARKQAAVLRVAPLVGLLYTVLVLWFAEGALRSLLAVLPVRPWYRHKRGFSFADILRTARRSLDGVDVLVPFNRFDNLQQPGRSSPNRLHAAQIRAA